MVLLKVIVLNLSPEHPSEEGVCMQESCIEDQGGIRKGLLLQTEEELY